MPIYKQSGSTLLTVKEKKIDLERNIQNLTEANATLIFGLKFVCSEFSLNNFRIDTLAFDEESKSFVIIEYKKDRSFSVVDQGFAYLALLLKNKADFILEYNEKTQKSLKKDEVDWSQSRVIFVAPSFTKYQREAIGFKDLLIDLWEVTQYEDGLVLFNELQSTEKTESIKAVAKGKNAEIVSKEIKAYSIEDHFKPNWVKSKSLFEIFSQQVLELDTKIHLRPVKHYIGFSIQSKNVVLVKIRQSKVLLELLRTRPEDLIDPEHKTRYMDKSFEHFNQYVSQFDIESEEDIEYAMSLVRQVYKKFFAE